MPQELKKKRVKIKKPQRAFRCVCGFSGIRPKCFHIFIFLISRLLNKHRSSTILLWCLTFELFLCNYHKLFCFLVEDFLAHAVMFGDFMAGNLLAGKVLTRVRVSNKEYIRRNTFIFTQYGRRLFYHMHVRLNL